MMDECVTTIGLCKRYGSETCVDHLALKVPQGAEVLLEAALPNLSAAQRRALMVKTALPAGYPLSGDNDAQQFWQRLNLPAAYAMANKAH